MPHLIQVIAACVSITIFVPLAMIFTMAGKALPNGTLPFYTIQIWS